MVLTSSSFSYKSVSQVVTSIQEGNLTTTTLALICLNEIITPDNQCIQAILDKRAVKLLLNILEAKFLCVRRSQFAALKCLTKLCDCKVLQKEVLKLNGIQLLFQCLNNFDMELMFIAVQLISNISSDPSSWEPAFECGGIYQLISLLDASQKKLSFTSQMNKTDIVKLKLSVAQFSAKALSLLCNFEANRKVACSSNIISICHYWVGSKHEQVIIPILILLQQLCVLVSFRKQINDSSMILDVLNHLQSTNVEVKQAAADLILICADDQETFNCFQKQEFVTEIFQMASNKCYHEDETLMTSLTGILWKCSKTDLAVRQLEKLVAVPVFTQLLESPSLQVKAHIIGTIGMCLKSPVLREIIKKNCIIENMMQYLQTTHVPLIINLNESLAKGSCDLEILNLYIQLDTVQLIWSHLKNSDIHVKSSAVQSLCIILKNLKKANLQIQNSLDGIECIIDILTSKNKKLLTPACSLIHNLAKDANAVSVLVEFNVANHLQRLMKTVLTNLLIDLRNKEGNESAAIILRHILCIYNKEAAREF